MKKEIKELSENQTKERRVFMIKGKSKPWKPGTVMGTLNKTWVQWKNSKSEGKKENQVQVKNKPIFKLIYGRNNNEQHKHGWKSNQVCR